MRKKRVLVTGIAGRIGSVVRDYLGDDYEMTGLDRVAVDEVPTRVGDLTDFDSIRPAFDGQEVVVHLGGEPNGAASWESVLQNNIVGTQNVFEACREAGVHRVVFASTSHVVGFIPEKEEPYRAIFDGRFSDARHPFPKITADAIRPDCFYAISKVTGEALGSLYHDKYGISCICLRIGGVSLEEGWERKFPAGLSMMLSHRDAAQLIQRSIDASPSVGYAIVYGMSNNSLRIHDIESARHLIGYEPQDDAGVVLVVEPQAGQYHRRAHP